jgi:hypothetical protein
VAGADLLLGVLRLALEEGALQGEGLAAFSRALHERARRLLEEQGRALREENAWRREAMAGLEERARALEQENAWRRDSMVSQQESVRALEDESSWRREAMASQQESLRSLEAESSWRREAIAGLEEVVRALQKQVEGLGVEQRKSAEAHDRLRAHHREVLGRVVAELLAVSSLRFPGLGFRKRLAALAERLGPETK